MRFTHAYYWLLLLVVVIVVVERGHKIQEDLNICHASIKTGVNTL